VKDWGTTTKYYQISSEWVHGGNYDIRKTFRKWVTLKSVDPKLQSGLTIKTGEMSGVRVMCGEFGGGIGSD